MSIVNRCMLGARWRRRGWVSRTKNSAADVAQDLELERDQAYWPEPWVSRLRIEAQRR